MSGMHPWLFFVFFVAFRSIIQSALLSFGYWDFFGIWGLRFRDLRFSPVFLMPASA
jgi:hypothetical protein